MGKGNECNHRSSAIIHAGHTHHDRFHLSIDVGIFRRHVRLDRNASWIREKSCGERTRCASHHDNWGSRIMVLFSWLRSTIVCALSITYLSSVPCPIPVLLVTAMLMIQIETMLSQPERDKGKTERDNRGN